MIKRLFDWFKRTKLADFSWIKTTKFVQLEDIDVSEDPVRPELDLEWRKSFDRKIFGLEHNKKIEAVMCLAFTNDIPHTVRELDLMSKINKYEQNADTVIAYTVWSNKKGAGKKIMEEALQYAKINGFRRIVTLSPLTPMATHYHIKNGARLIGLNPTTQNFEYSLDN